MLEETSLLTGELDAIQKNYKDLVVNEYLARKASRDIAIEKARSKAQSDKAKANKAKANKKTPATNEKPVINTPRRGSFSVRLLTGQD